MEFLELDMKYMGPLNIPAFSLSYNICFINNGVMKGRINRMLLTPEIR